MKIPYLNDSEYLLPRQQLMNKKKRAHLCVNFHDDPESLNNNLLWILLHDFQHETALNKGTLLLLCLNSLSANPTKWLNTPRQFVGSSSNVAT